MSKPGHGIGLKSDTLTLTILIDVQEIFCLTSTELENTKLNTNKINPIWQIIKCDYVCKARSTINFIFNNK